MLRGFFTEYGMGVLNAFQCEYDENLKRSKMSSKVCEKIQEIGLNAQRKLGIEFRNDSDAQNDYPYGGQLSVIEFLNLKPELRQCAERIGHLGLYENASDLIHSDPTLSYILEIEGGGSAGLWASLIHDRHGAFSENPEGFDMWENFSKLVRRLLIKLDEYKNDEYARIVVNGDTSIVPKYYIKKAGSFMRETTTVEEYQVSDDA